MVPPLSWLLVGLTFARPGHGEGVSGVVGAVESVARPAVGCGWAEAASALASSMCPVACTACWQAVCLRLEPTWQPRLLACFLGVRYGVFLSFWVVVTDALCNRGVRARVQGEEHRAHSPYGRGSLCALQAPPPRPLADTQFCASLAGWPVFTLLQLLPFAISCASGAV